MSEELVGWIPDPEPESDLARHIANPEMELLVVEYVGRNQYGDPVAVCMLPESEPRRFYSAEIITWSGARTAAAVNEYGSRYEAWSNAVARARTDLNEGSVRP